LFFIDQKKIRAHLFRGENHFEPGGYVLKPRGDRDWSARVSELLNDSIGDKNMSIQLLEE
jgi:hypothetical protein